MDLIVCTTCPEEVKVHPTEGSEKMLLTWEILKIRSVSLPELAARRSWVLPGLLSCQSTQGTGIETRYCLHPSVVQLVQKTPINSLGRNSVSICGAERTQLAPLSILWGFYKQSRIIILWNSAAILMLRPSKAIHNILVNKLIYILIENSFPKDSPRIFASNIEDWLRRPTLTFMAKDTENGTGAGNVKRDFASPLWATFLQKEKEG